MDAHGLPPEQANLQVAQARTMLGVRIGVCSDVHGRHDRLLAVLGAMAAAGVDERWLAIGGPPRLISPFAKHATSANGRASLTGVAGGYVGWLR